MKLRSILLCGALSAASLPAADTLTGEFQRALFEEEANRNLPAAIAGYEAVIKRLDERRQLAATAVFRLGESYRKLGKTNEAVAAYERIVKEFADQETLVKLSGQNLSVLRPRQIPVAFEERMRQVNQLSGGQASDFDGESELRRLEILLETVRSLESMSEEELRTLSEFAGDDEVAGYMKVMGRARRGLESTNGLLRERPGDDRLQRHAKQMESEIESSELFLRQWRDTALRMLEARVEAARRLAGREPSEAQFSTASQLDPATRSRQKELLEAEILLVGRQLSEVSREVEAGTLSSVTLLPGMLDLHRLRRELAAFEGGPDAKANQLRHAEKEVTLMDQLISAKSEQVESGQAPSSELIQLERQKLGLQREIIRLNSRMEASASSSPVTETMTAEEAEELRRVQALAANSPDLMNVVDSSDGQAPLHRAIQKGHQQVVSFLIRNGVDVNRPSNPGWLPVHVAASGGQLAALRLLADAGADLSPRDRQGRTPLHLAVQLGRDSVAAYLLEKGVDPNAANNDGQNALHLAASAGRTNLMVQLLEGGAGLEIGAPALSSRGVRHESGEISLRYNGTPLCFAVANGKSEAVELLLERGANVNPPGVEVQPLAIAVTVGDTNMVRRLITTGAKVEGQPLVERALVSMPAEIPFLLEAGADPNLTSEPNSRSSLLRAAEMYGTFWAETNRHVPRDDGAVGTGGVVVQGSVGAPPPRLARNVDWEAVVKALVTHGADVNAVHDRRTVLTWLASLPNPTPLELIAWLLENGADPNLGGGRTASSTVQASPVAGGFLFSPLNAACKAGNVELAALLIKHGARLEAPEGQDEWPPLRVAVNFRQHDIVRLLLEKGAKPNALDAQGKTALYVLFNKRLLPGPPETETLWSGNRKTFSGTASPSLVSSQTLPDDLATTRLLLERGSRLDLPLADSLYLPIHFAAAIEDDRFLKLFLEFKADPNTTNAVGVTPLHAAAAMNQSENIRLLVQTGADVNRPDQNGDTPLHIAAFLNRVSASEVLLELGADRERKNRFGVNPVQVQSFSQGIRTNKRPPFGLPEYLDPIKNVTDVLGR